VVRRILIISGLFIAGALYLAYASKSESIPIRKSLSELPNRIGQWQEKDSSEFASDTLKVLGVDDYINRTYSSPEGKTVGLYIGYYKSQSQGDTIHSPLNCLPGSGWNPIKKSILGISVDSNSGLNRSNIKINQIIVQKGLDKQAVLYWYQSHGRVIASEYWDKIYTVIDAIRINRTDAALVRIICPITGPEENSETDAEQDATLFVRNLFPLLKHHLPD
jgi:EpsI family protein